MSFFKRPATHYGKTPEPETPYQRAAQIWDDRIGSARVQARNWRLMAFGCLILSAGFAAALVWQSARGTIVPWVVQVDNLGQAQAVAPAQADYRPTDPQVAWHLARFIEMIRGLPQDPIVVRQNWLRAYDWVTQGGAQVLNAMATEDDPFAKVGKRTVAIEVISVVRASPESFQLRWRESTYASGTLIDVERYSGVASIVIAPSSSPEQLAKNPLGLYVHAFNYSRDLQQ